MRSETRYARNRYIDSQNRPAACHSVYQAMKFMIPGLSLANQQAGSGRLSRDAHKMFHSVVLEVSTRRLVRAGFVMKSQASFIVLVFAFPAQ